MNIQKYKNQVHLLLRVLPYVAEEECFALHGETAINLFVRDMPRLSVDIDLTYLPIEDRQITLQNISDVLERIRIRIKTTMSHAQILYKSDIGKLLIRTDRGEIKLEVNLVGRGTLETLTRMMLCNKAQEIYDTSSII